MIGIKNKKIVIATLAIFLMLTTSFSAFAENVYSNTKNDKIENQYQRYTSDFLDLPSAVAVSDSNPFYTLIATPLAVHYNETGSQEIIPLYVKDFDDPSKAVERAEQQIGIFADYTIGDMFSARVTSLIVADTFWESASGALIIEDSQEGYELGIVAVPLASYLGIPVIVTDTIDSEITDMLDSLSVEYVYICGDLVMPLNPTAVDVTFLSSVNQIIDTCIDVISDRLSHEIDYITMANPLDVYPPNVLEQQFWTFEGSINSIVVLPTQLVNMMVKGNGFASHEFIIPEEYKYTNLKIDFKSKTSENAEKLGDRFYIMVLSPEGERYVYGGTGGGIPVRDEEGNIVEDCIHYEVALYDKPGTYEFQTFGQFFGTKSADYEVTITIQRLDSPFVPTMPGISTIAPYLTAYHKGIMFAKPEFAFAADDDVFFNGTTCPGVSQPGTNPSLIEPSNNHTLGIHAELNELLANLAGISVGNLENLTDYYKNNPVYIALAADPTMVPMYFYYNPDGRPEQPAHTMGFAVPSDYIYADVDVDLDDPENDTYSYWPFMENIVGRVTGYDIQDCSALIARTIYYDEIISKLGDWKEKGLVQTGCGLEFQNLPVITRLGKLIGALTGTGRDEPTKWPTGESMFINMRLKSMMELGGFDVKNTFWLESQREGFSRSELAQIKKLGFANLFLFPNNLLYSLTGDKKVTGGQDQQSASFIFAFAHGFYNLYEFGDIFTNVRGFPFVSVFARIYPRFGSSLADRGSFDLRSINNMKYGPAVVFIESCITGRTDGINGNNTISQTYLHAGANAYIGATRVTADPGYLEPRPLPGGWGIGTIGFRKAFLRWKLKGEFPDAHFGAVIAEDFILQLAEEDATTGLALRNAKNLYLPKDANTTFLWTPPLTLSSGSFVDYEFLEALGYNDEPDIGDDRTPVLDKKYVALHEFTLYGDPAFNPYQPVNNG